jgi:hypothetical protein
MSIMRDDNPWWLFLTCALCILTAMGMNSCEKKKLVRATEIKERANALKQYEQAIQSHKLVGHTRSVSHHVVTDD